MRVRWLGWAGVEVEAEGERVVVDPLGEPAATFAPLGGAAEGAALPEVVPAEPSRALAGLVTHLHRDHTDAPALAAALAPGARVFEPPRADGEPVENLALAQADAELSRSGLQRAPLAVWESRVVGPFTLTALPAVDGLGDPQVAWLIEGEGRRVLHLGDTIYHSYWWRIAHRHGPFDLVLAPINGAVISFPHLRPPSPLASTLEPEQAVLAAEILGARAVAPIHYGGYAAAGLYEPTADPLERFLAAAGGRGFTARVAEPGETLEVA